MQPAEAYILKSELAMRRHAVLVPAEVPAAKRQRTSGSAELAEPRACARAHAFVSDSPLSPSKVPRPVSAAAQIQKHEITDSPVESPDVFTGEEATFAVRTDSELEPLPAPQAARDTAEDARADMAIGSHKAHLQNSSRPPESDTNPDSHSDGANATSQQQSTANADTSAPSTMSYETSMRAAVSTSEVDSPSSPHVPDDHIKADGDEAPEATPAAQAASPQTARVSAGYITVPQLLLLGPYLVDAEQQKIVAQSLQIYKARVDEVHALGRRKPDMIAHKELRGQLSPPRVHGHIPGVELGARFGGRGEIAILGIHTQMMRGIDSFKGAPAYCIVMSGGYRDDVDAGLEVQYTGEGGQSKGKHVRDQTWTSGNLALQDSLRLQVPVRVVRGSHEKSNKMKELVYTYDGLYQVTAATLETGQEGFKICKFKLKALPGHSKAGQKVTYGALKGAKFKQLALAQRGSRMAVPPHAAAATQAASRLKDQEARRLTALQGRPGLLALDISGGKEARRIPVFNQVDTDQPPTDLDYIRYQEGVAATACVPATASATQVLAAADAVMGFRHQCGLRVTQLKCQYTDDGRLWETNKYGVYECAAAAASSVAKHNCKDAKNRVVSQGLQLPLEVFKTSNGRGWGVRCSSEIPIGTFVCDYVGKLLTDHEADQSSNDEYLFDLDHFVSMAAEPSSDVDPKKLPPLPKAMYSNQTESEVHLVLDARVQGNVARFINHSCKGNLVIQPVFTDGCNALLYRIALFASEEIPAFTELTYDYGYASGVVHNRLLECKCGSEQCRKRLL
ncbi:hypothetical protein ABBQ32_012213 [Trebouxia sp. C0010 RCD-2024]